MQFDFGGVMCDTYTLVCLVRTRLVPDPTWAVFYLGLGGMFASNKDTNKRPVGLYSPLTAGIMTDFVIMIL